MIAAVKFAHIAALSAWCVGLIALPLLLHSYGAARRQRRFSEFRILTHTSYVAFTTPAAVLAVAAGTALVFMTGVFEPWLLVKLALVAGMTLIHAWLGHLILQSGESRGRWRMPPPLIALGLVLPLIGAVLWLVLAKPDLGAAEAWMPARLLAPQGFSL